MTPLKKQTQPDISVTVCSYSKVLDIISSKWSALVIYALEDGTIRYGDIQRRIEGISKKMLTQTLRQLERDGLIWRELHASVPPITQYTLTPLGETLLLPLRELKQWANSHYADVKKARVDYDLLHGKIDSE
ncbi:winged helix-turn-helix transcriptional regulator [Paenibacillus sp. GCM10027627]|uniref:winged helix-turn-helix transcriptional regulator n=1 Tax=unclassified Paenibacillus TaxID=185978 RepID=UPI00363A52AA